MKRAAEWPSHAKNGDDPDVYRTAIANICKQEVKTDIGFWPKLTAIWALGQHVCPFSPSDYMVEFEQLVDAYIKEEFSDKWKPINESVCKIYNYLHWLREATARCKEVA